MKDLASLQRAFQRHVDRPGRAMELAVHATPAAGAARRLGVYADAYRSRLAGALATDYPALKCVLGGPGFERMMREFIARNPSRQANLRWYGEALAGFLARSPIWSRRPLLHELAQFEWALGIAFDAADAPTVSAEEVARIAPSGWPGLLLSLHPSVQLLRLRCNAPEIWHAAIEGHERPLTARGSRQVTWLVWRRGHEPFYRKVPSDEAWALGAISRGREFASLVDGLRRFAGTSQAAQSAAQLLRNWLTEGLICAIK